VPLSLRLPRLWAGIARKTLSQHEIATIQTTAIDRDSGTVKLTTIRWRGSADLLPIHRPPTLNT
jgi:hypothetical protein